MAAAAASQVQIGGTKPNSSVKAGDCCTDGNEQAETVLQLTELYSFGNDNMPKVRKPYTITKQREKWTEEEHQRFLEALKLYGRGWRKIQEHIGTKTAVQIRSHAQKFFSKVARESSGSTESSLKPIEIPPPRPKRKPVHPYPRKPVDIYDGTSAVNQLERSSSPNSSISEKENRSPTSVLSAMASTLSEQQNGCSSPSSCTTDMRSISLSPVKEENERITSNSSMDGERGISPSTQLSSSHILEKFLSNKVKSASKDCVSIKGDVTEVASSGSIKLFGKTVMVADIQRKFPAGAELMLSVTSTESRDNVDVGNERPTQTLQRNQLDTGLSLGMACTIQNVLASPASFFDFMQPERDIANSSTPYSAFCQDAPFLYLTSYDHASPYRSVSSSMEERSEEKEILNERSCTGSNAVSVGELDNGERNLDVVDSQYQQSSVDLSSSLQKRARGFVPCKRCLGERDVIPTAIVSKEREPQRARVCSKYSPTLLTYS